MVVTTEQNNYQKIYTPLIKLLNDIDNLYTKKSIFNDDEIEKKIIDLCGEALILSKEIKKAGENETTIDVEIIDKIEVIIKEVKLIFTDFLLNLNGHEKLFLYLYKSLLVKDEDWNLVPINSYENLKYIDITYIDAKGFNNFDVTDDYKNTLLVLPPLNMNENLSRFIYAIDDFDILYSLIFCIDFQHGMPEGNNIALIGTKFTVDKNQLIAYIKLKKVSMGEVLHNSYIYTQPVNIGARAGWNIQKKYQQFEDIINVLSEYNQQLQILDKFLKIYQVIENFKYRSKIATLIDEYGEKMFSIRRLKALYSQIESGESKELNKLLKTILSLDCNGTSMKDILISDWNNYKSGRNINLLEEELREIGCKSTPNISEDFLTNCIYSLRNSIAHNKETEIHLTHGSLHEYPEIENLLKSFLLEALEKIVYSLLIEESFIWYRHSKFSLYK